LNAKLAAAIEAVRMIRDGQVVGLGSGSTAEIFIVELGKRVRDEGLEIIGIPTSKKSEAIGREAGIPISSLDENSALDITVDGADEVDPNLDLIKGLGGALLREKMVARATRKVVIVVDESKLVHQLGTKAPLPVEVVQFSQKHLAKQMTALGCVPMLRQSDSKPYVTDNGNYIIDCMFKGIDDPHQLERKLKGMPGVVETGLFLGMADTIIVGAPTGVRTMKRKEPKK